MKSILMSIKPKWVEKIASGEKTVEVRKTVPKCGAPFKVYMYCGKGKPFLYKNANNNEIFIDSDLYRGGDYEERFLSGKVVGEFVVDTMYYFVQACAGIMFADEDLALLDPQDARDMTCLTDDEISEYLGDKDGYGLHISDLKIYDKPKELSEFKKVKKVRGYHKSGENKVERLMHADRIEVAIITRPPQSWQYVEEL